MCVCVCVCVCMYVCVCVRVSTEHIHQMALMINHNRCSYFKHVPFLKYDDYFTMMLPLHQNCKSKYKIQIAPYFQF